MFQFLNSIGTMLSSACALGFAAFWGWSSVFISPKSSPDAKIFGEAGLLVVGGLLVGIVLVGMYMFVTSLRNDAAKVQPKLSTAEPEAATQDFDPDEIIARYLANKALQPAPVMRVRPVERFRSAPAVRSFGRKTA